ncbi:hypothetical protein APUTEX25_003340 [Auxenochlorella protothecoides]|uniref:Acyl-coenzyme A oxidase 4, peroxisomal n=1 Tax=Auxenochlorella protothecoides TaxID=3075 RepID=A0A3M7KSM1_AUXPR|nr:hypothetical protein APUTEX25_003340 [Auxenochlorella protothecoides]|eukprot:RMZ53518.1 hypothetical protein APUTEX25_003340 [Auxenochlorella protothecoides]
MTVFPPARHDALELEELFTPEEKAIKARVRAFAEQHAAPIINKYWEKAEFPHELRSKFGELGIGGAHIKSHGCQGLTTMGAAAAIVELGRVDGSLSTFFLVHSYLGVMTLGLLGSEAQKAELLPGLSNFSKVAAWALTEPSNGSDASALTTTARKVPGGWILDGRKRWIGNATFADVVIVWARSSETGQVNAFIVRKGNPGFRATKIEHKISLRCVQNADIHLTGAFVPDADRLPGVESFADAAGMLAMSRCMVAWQPVGLVTGVYDMVLRYTSQRRQFGAPLASFQLVQERLARMQATIQAMYLMCHRLSQLYDAGRMSHEQASLVKAWTTARAREVVALGRECLGGNGIVADFLVAKAFVDAEAYYTYEGTYDVNVLVAARGQTGYAAFKTAGRANKAPPPTH